ncbi:MAG: hypothetical protein E7589_03930 [Ruminococcaceae bacterium]|nr:hypothetical protein [Oscillospiraceae bacterium]
MSSTSNNRGNLRWSDFAVSFIVFLLAVAIVNGLFFGRANGKESAVKVNAIGDTLILEYAKNGEAYTVEGIEHGQFNEINGIFSFYNYDYRVSDEGDAYPIRDSRGKQVGSVLLQKKSEMEFNKLEVDLAEYSEELLNITPEYNYVRIYSSTPDVEHKLSVYVEERYENLDIVLDNVQIKAPDLSPALYSFSSSDINLSVQGNVSVKGGDNPYTAESISVIDNFVDTVGTAAYAYYYCISSAKSTAMSIIHGIDYYAQMFEGVMYSQLETVENAWDKVEDLVNGRDGAPGLDGVAGIIITGDLNLITHRAAVFTVEGGSGSNGGNAQSGLISGNNGGDGGKGGSAIVCENLATYNDGELNFYAGMGGLGGRAGTTALGDSGRDGTNGGAYENRVVRGFDVTVK